jgi:hypothetical protein
MEANVAFENFRNIYETVSKSRVLYLKNISYTNKMKERSNIEILIPRIRGLSDDQLLPAT